MLVSYPTRVDRDGVMRVLRAFAAAKLEYMLIGATAMGVHGLIRATEGVDIFIRATSENVERLRAALRTAYADDPHISEILSDDLLGDYPAVRYYPPSGDLYLDVLTRLGEVASFETQVTVPTRSGLYKLKKGSVRLQDQADAAGFANGEP